MDRDDRVLAIHLAREHRPDLGGLDVALIGVEALREIGGDVFALAGPVNQHADVVGLAAERRGKRTIFLEPATALKNLLRPVLVFPEIRRRGLGFDLAQFTFEAGFVKGPSAGRPCAR
jgi:hypothetical protein